MIDAQTLSGPTDITEIRKDRRWSPGSCVWCGDDSAVEMFRREPRCGTCREKESVIDAARHFVGMYGLRPLGGTLQSDDEEELEHRVNARNARRELNEMKLAELPDPAEVREALRPRVATVVPEPSTTPSGTPSTSAPDGPSVARKPVSHKPATRKPASRKPASRKPASRPAASKTTDAVDVSALETRVTGLLDQLSAIDEQMTLIGEPAGLAARARVSDLEKQRATVLRTLAALEKARIAASG
ncbi:hypothetical protein [Rhodococcus sp. NPDC049939]|uniref:hypothetical protein n=1 Tax=Rhodococcus sp. NPDC049939 TaxID=3155511 RepID=UPI0033CC3BBC